MASIDNNVVYTEGITTVETEENVTKSSVGMNVEQSVTVNEITDLDQRVVNKLSNLRNEAIPALWRYGIPLYLLATLSLLFVSHVGSGVSAKFILNKSDGSIFQEHTLLKVSIFTSVKKLWNTGSFPLAIWIALTSISWPYLKLALGMFAWVVPSRNHRQREQLLEVADVLGKWSFVDIFVLLIIMVAFRSSISLGFGVNLEIVIVPLWGFYGFVVASILSLLGNHIILYFHRHLHCHNNDQGSETTLGTDAQPSHPELESLAKVSHLPVPLIAFLLAGSCALQAAGVVVNIYELIEERPTYTTSEAYSILRVGLDVPQSTLEPNAFGIRWVQAMYFFLAIALPLTNSVLIGILYMFPMTKPWQDRLFVLAEITFSWSCAEVLMISAVFSILQIPLFGNGLVDAGCNQCYHVSSRILPAFSLVVISAVMQCSLNVWLLRQAHKVLYPDVSRTHNCAQCVQFNQ